jgi:hypothetical protein
MHQLYDLKRPTSQRMKKTLHILVSILCLLTIMLNATRCMHAEQAKQPSCSHCPKRAPVSHQTPPCCVAQQQVPSVPSARVEASAPADATFVPLRTEKLASFYSLLVKEATAAPPPSPPRIALRI